MGLADRGARHLVRARAREAARRRRRSRCSALAWTFVAVYVVVPHVCRRGTAPSTASTTSVGGSPVGVARRRSSPIRARCSGRCRGARLRLPDLARASAPLPLRALARARRRRAAAAARERALGLPLDDGPALPQRGGGHPVPRRRDGLRDRADRRAATRRSPPRPSSSCSAHARARRRALGAAVGAVPLGGERVRLRRSRIAALARCGRARAQRCAGHGLEHRRRTPLRAAVRLLRAACSGEPSGSSSTARIRGSCGRDSPILTHHPEVVRGVRRSARGRSRRGRRSSSATASSCFRKRRRELASAPRSRDDRELVVCGRSRARPGSFRKSAVCERFVSSTMTIR